MNDKVNKDLQYRPNTPLTLTLGAGITYHNISLNLSYGFKFLNTDNDEKGKPRYFDMQGHWYDNKWAVDWFGQFYRHYYLYPKGYASDNINNYYLRPDAKVNLIGVAAYRLPNGERFSYRAALIQNEWQKKSAGSILFGGEAYYGTIKADSSLVPKQVEKELPLTDLHNIQLLSFGAGIGYAYTLVVKQHFFITGSLVANLDLNFSSETGTNLNSNQVTLNPAAVFKAAAGYNSSTWDLSCNWVGNAIWFKGASSAKYLLQTGNYRIILAKKIMWKTKRKNETSL